MTTDLEERSLDNLRETLYLKLEGRKADALLAEGTLVHLEHLRRQRDDLVEDVKKLKLRHDEAMAALRRSTDVIAEQRDAAAKERDLLVTWMRNLPSPEDIDLARLEIERSPDVIAAIRKLNEASE